jgi:hypothetical protein
LGEVRPVAGDLYLSQLLPLKNMLSMIHEITDSTSLKNINRFAFIMKTNVGVVKSRFNFPDDIIFHTELTKIIIII